MDIWEKLELSPTSDKKIIKRAYAKLIKLHHPEDDPEAFRQIYDAYQAAIAYADMSITYSVRNKYDPGLAISQSDCVNHDIDHEHNAYNQEYSDAFEEAKLKCQEYYDLWMHLFVESLYSRQTFQQWVEVSKLAMFEDLKMNISMVQLIIEILETQPVTDSGLYLTLRELFGFNLMNWNLLWTKEHVQLKMLLDDKIAYLKQRENIQMQAQRMKDMATEQKKRDKKFLIWNGIFCVGGMIVLIFVVIFICLVFDWVGKQW